MRFGLLLPSELPSSAIAVERAQQLRSLVELARDVGFSSLWALHHHVSNVPTLQPVPLLANLAPYSGGMTLGTAVLVLPVRHPVVVAEDFATLDVISGGRTILGAAVGYYKPEFRALGVPLAERASRIEESIDVLRTLWRGDEITADGEHFRLAGVRLSMLPAQKDGPPIYLGGMSSAAIQRAAGFGDGWLLPPDLDVEVLIRKISTYRAAMDKLGRAINVLPAQRECLIAESGEEARALAEPYLRQNAAIYAGRGMTWVEDQFERWFESSYLVGQPDQIAERIVELEQVGVTEVHLRVGWGDLPFEAMMRTVELVGRHLVERG